jgi:anti-sigma regulatory factor (Ser/Thr protein kinase)
MCAAASCEFPIRELNQTGAARRSVADIGARLGFDAVASGNLAIVVTELATNLAKHAREGMLIVRVVEDVDGPSIEVLSIDRGPGIDNVESCLTDGFSTSGTAGTGLGAVRRLSENWDLLSIPGNGTVQVARVPARRTTNASPVMVSGISIPAPGEIECGDAWAWVADGPYIRIVVADGLGHGPAAAIASNQAIQTFQDQPNRPPAEMIREIHTALRSTRGAAVSVLEFDTVGRSVRYSGVGNIAAQIASPARRQNLVSLNGTVGAQLPTPREFQYEMPPGAVLCCWSDGLTSRTAPEAIPGLLHHDPALIAALLYRDFKRGRDDATVVVCRG